ncbi:MAG: dUTP diphosphatase [archaeon]
MKKEGVLKVKRLSSTAELPCYALDSDLGFDLRADESITLAPYEQKEVKTGVAIQIPDNHIGLIRDRAGIVTKMGVHTAAGTFDPGFRGEVSIVLINFGEQTIQVEKGMRIAQMIIMPVSKVKIQEVKSLPLTERYDRGFLSTGLNNGEKEKNKNTRIFRFKRKKEVKNA